MKRILIVGSLLVQCASVFGARSVTCDISQGAPGTHGTFILRLAPEILQFARGQNNWVFGDVELGGTRSPAIIQVQSALNYTTYLLTLKKGDDFAAGIVITTNGVTNRGTGELTHLFTESNDNIPKGSGACTVQN